jgi:hypothetical protein
MAEGIATQRNAEGRLPPSGRDREHGRRSRARVSRSVNTTGRALTD